MALTAAQLSALKAAIQADPYAAPLAASGSVGAVAQYLNGTPTSTAPTLLWRKEVTGAELFHALYAPDVLTLTAPQLAVLQLAGLAGTVDFSNPNIQAGLGRLFGPQSTTAANIAALAVRAATRFEAIFATAQGQASVTPVYGQQVDAPTIQQAMGS